MALTRPKYFVPDPYKFRIFAIGFNKCGTRSLFQFFKKNGIPSVHYDGGRIAGSMFRHFNNARPLIDIRYRKKVFFADMENIYQPGSPLYAGQYFYQLLAREYPNSVFILNTRDKEKWLKSRILHENGHYLQYLANKLGLTKPQVVQGWSQEWDDHHQAVQDYFRNKPNRLLVFNIEKDPISKVVKFFKNNYHLQAKYYHHVGKSTQKYDSGFLDMEAQKLYHDCDCDCDYDFSLDN